MTELKTLKDLPLSEIEFTRYHKETMIPKKELKAEAVKWVKESENGENWICDMIEANIWIKHFFNLTEEDLK